MLALLGRPHIPPVPASSFLILGGKGSAGNPRRVTYLEVQECFGRHSSQLDSKQAKIKWLSEKAAKSAGYGSRPVKAFFLPLMVPLSAGSYPALPPPFVYR